MIELDLLSPISDPKDLYGRDPELKRVVQTLLSGKSLPVIILGERRVGKTSFQNIVIRQLQNDAPGYFTFVQIESKGIATCDAFAVKILDELAAYYPKTIAEAGLEQVGDAFRLPLPEQFGLVFHNLAGLNPPEHFLIYVDEFDEIMRHASPQETARLDALIHHLTKQPDLPISFLLTMTYLPPQLRYSYPSPFTGMAEIIDLHLLSAVATTSMVNGLSDTCSGLLGRPLMFSSAALGWLYHTTGGHPYFTKLILDQLLCMTDPSVGLHSPWNISPTDLSQALTATMRSERCRLAVKNLYDKHFSENEKYVLFWVADCETLLPLEKLREAGVALVTAARNLVTRDYLIESDAGFEFRIPFLKYWLEQ